MRWFRFYSDVLDDPKVQRLPGDLFKAWINLLCLANQGTERGVLPSLEDIAFRLRMSEEEATEVIVALTERGLLDEVDDDLTPHNWGGRQPKSDNVTERVQRHRAKQETKQAPPKSDVQAETPPVVSETLPKRSRNVPDKKRVDTEKSREDQSNAVAIAPADTPAALVDAYCQARGQPFPEDAGVFVNIGKSLQRRGYTSADVEQCTRYLLTDPYWEPILTFKILASQLPDWAQNGRPEKAPTKATTHRNGRPREPDFSGIDAFDEQMSALEQRR